MSDWKAIFRNDTGQEVWETPLVETNGQFFWLNGRGFREPFNREFQHPTLGRLTHSRTAKAEEQPPQPRDPERERLVAALDKSLRITFSNPDALQTFLGSAPEIERGLNTDFEGVSIEQIGEWITRINKSVAKPNFTMEQRRRRFTGQTLGDLSIGREQIASSTANDWNGTFDAECKCRKLKGSIRVEHLLEMQNGLRELFRCGNPCHPGKG